MIAIAGRARREKYSQFTGLETQHALSSTEVRTVSERQQELALNSQGL